MKGFLASDAQEFSWSSLILGIILRILRNYRKSMKRKGDLVSASRSSVQNQRSTFHFGPSRTKVHWTLCTPRTSSAPRHHRGVSLLQSSFCIKNKKREPIRILFFVFSSGRGICTLDTTGMNRVL